MIAESDYDYGYSCSSEVYQSITGAQLWSPSHTSRQSSSSVCSTPTRQPCRTVDNSAPVVPSYYLRSLSPPPVVDHYSTGENQVFTSNVVVFCSCRISISSTEYPSHPIITLFCSQFAKYFG